MTEFAADTAHFLAKRKDLSDAIELTNAATLLGRLAGGALSLFAWWPSGAPWWAIPVFAIVVGWIGGKIYGLRTARGLERKLKAKYPELKL